MRKLIITTLGLMILNLTSCTSESVQVEHKPNVLIVYGEHYGDFTDTTLDISPISDDQYYQPYYDYTAKIYLDDKHQVTYGGQPTANYTCWLRAYRIDDNGNKIGEYRGAPGGDNSGYDFYKTLRYNDDIILY